MVATQFTGSERRALRWMRRRGSGLQPSEPAFQLLGRRLAVRWWAGWVSYLPLAVFVVLWTQWSPSSTAGRPVVVSVLLALLPVAAFGVAQIAFVAICRRGDRRIAAALTHRISRPQAVGVRTVIGPLASVLVGLAVAGHVAIAVVLLRRDTATDAVAYSLGAAVVGLLVAVTLRQAVRRPTVAVDDTALAVDERMRATDALLSLWPLYWAAFGLITPLDLRGSTASGLVLWLSTALVIGSSFVWFSHPDQRARYGRGGIWGPA